MCRSNLHFQLFSIYELFYQFVDDIQCTWIAEGGFFIPNSGKPCHVCYCYGGKAECRDISDECDKDIKCPDGDIIAPFGQCCPICKVWAAAEGESYLLCMVN